MRKTRAIILASVILMTGCAKEADNQTPDVGETIPIESREIPTKPIIEIPEGEKIDENDVKYFIDDKYFYDEKEIDFGYYIDTENTEEVYHIKIVSAKAFSAVDLQKIDSDFEQSKEKIEEMITECMGGDFGYSEDEVAIVETEYEITNISEEAKEFSCRQPLLIWMRIPDRRGTAYGLADKRIDFATPYIEFWRVSSKSGKMSNYSLNLSAGETVNLKCLYLVPKEFIKYELYLSLYNVSDGEYNKELKCQFPTNNELTKFLRLYIEEE